ncbi:hypothetical protein L1276_003674 [Flavobacterium sp. HSC-32F16]|nr:hypothetical protein [Flavobacterium sp. HSC-32F16]
MLRHITHIYISKNSESDFKVISKGLGLLADGSVASLTFLDIVKASSNGMRLASRILKFF